MSILSRRKLLAGATAGLGSALIGSSVTSATARAAPLRLDALQLNPTHVLTLSAADFAVVTFDTGTLGIAWSQQSDGLLRGNVSAFLAFHAPLHLPVGATISKITWHVNVNSNYDLDFIRYTPSTQVSTVISTTQTNGLISGPQSVVVTPSHTIESNASYVLRTHGLFGGAGVYGATIEYTLAPEGFVPLPAAIRDLNTRDTHSPKLQPGAEQVVKLSVPGANRAAVFNITLTETEGVGGYVACFAADIAWPGNSSINWNGPGVDIANLVICSTDAGGNIRIRGGAAATHVIIDTIGYIA